MDRIRHTDRATDGQSDRQSDSNNIIKLCGRGVINLTIPISFCQKGILLFFLLCLKSEK